MSNYQQNFNLSNTYPCPVCRHGDIDTLPLMEALACNFCNHIFVPNLEQQILKMADSQLPLSWRWDGRHWRSLRQEEVDFSWLYLVAAIAFVAFPTSIVSLGAYFFPPLPGTPMSWFPLFWAVLTLFSHLACLAWLLVEYYQFPLGLYLRAIGRRWLSL